jgi:uncharacterized protein YegP (UPF0339 family)
MAKYKVPALLMCLLTTISIAYAASCHGHKAPNPVVAPVTPPGPTIPTNISKVRFETYRDNKLEYRWRVVRLGNNHILADSAEGYLNKQDMLNAINLVKTCRAAVVVESERQSK